ncbi:MAG: methytransferase partner Trm112 [Candidatus Nitrosocaldus sp.]|nr:methytransferase partner Trm112 [Candidatus Nitrosocaldus sp.]MCS7141850.1 methytransferase partner Trm112 [Candidatus Nitrosocaldus sp.]MDW8000555.1 methytransferase partner Trm112 [Candidatus Nitrosocaldus sp.]MDW8275494.1 methytransferase partner Trm112 [Candidatus Nitrosocaldus sp.]
MRRWLLDILVCPMDKSVLQLRVFEERDDEIVEGLLTCTECKRLYPITKGIPVLLPDELRDKKMEQEFFNRWRDRLDA